MVGLLNKLREPLLEMKFPPNAYQVLKARYLKKNHKGKICETPTQMFLRVAKTIAGAEEKSKASYFRDRFFQIMDNLEFLPNSPTLMNAGASFGQLSACFVLPIEDSIESIFEAVKIMGIIHQTGGGTGFSFSNLRPEGDIVASTGGRASGPVSFMKIFDSATSVVIQGGRRRGANMGVLNIQHPDILKFIKAKEKEGAFSNFNLSVAISDNFMRSLQDKEYFYLINPRTKKRERKIKSASLFHKLCEASFNSGEPGVVFIDRINKLHPIKTRGKIEATNPCGEVPLLAYESCNLGSINLSKIVEKQKINWEKLRELIHLGVRFLDNVIEVNNFPVPQIEKATKANRKIGLGVMGFADMLIKLRIRYDSTEALQLAEKIMRFISEEARQKSAEMGEERGSFPNFEKSIWKDKHSAMRNATVTTIAPTGSISIIAGCSSGIEPIFAISFIRNVLGGTRLFETNPLFERTAKERGFYSAKLLEEIAKTGSVQKIDGVPEDVKKIFVTALDIAPEWHVQMQAAFQKYTDNAVSKTVNMPNEATVEDVRRVFELAWKLKCKGITVFRYGSKPEQVLYIGEVKTKEKSFVSAESEYAGGCPTKTCPFPS